MKKLNVLGVMTGDCTGVGPEVTVKALSAFRAYDISLLVIGDINVIKLAQDQCGIKSNCLLAHDFDLIRQNPGTYFWQAAKIDLNKIEQGKVSGYSGRMAGDTLLECLSFLQKEIIDGLTFAPLNKTALKEGGYNFEDEHRMFAHYLGWRAQVCEINVLDNMFTARVTSHIPLSEVTANITEEKILAAIQLLDSTLKQTGLVHPRIAVAGLNPHAGDYGACGREEIEIIQPAVKKAQNSGINATGPLAADTLFVQAMKKQLYDGVVTMYHDQGQIALKTQGFERCVTISGGLPYPITTPAQGTAFDIAGKNLATGQAFSKALEIAARMVKSKQLP